MSAHDKSLDKSFVDAGSSPAAPPIHLGDLVELIEIPRAYGSALHKAFKLGNTYEVVKVRTIKEFSMGHSVQSYLPDNYDIVNIQSGSDDMNCMEMYISAKFVRLVYSV